VAEIARDQREQIGRLRERIVPDGVVAAVRQVAASTRLPLASSTGASALSASMRVV
jgi:hypothetical protein